MLESHCSETSDKFSIEPITAILVDFDNFMVGFHIYTVLVAPFPRNNIGQSYSTWEFEENEREISNCCNEQVAWV